MDNWLVRGNLGEWVFAPEEWCLGRVVAPPTQHLPAPRALPWASAPLPLQQWTTGKEWISGHHQLAEVLCPYLSAMLFLPLKERSYNLERTENLPSVKQTTKWQHWVVILRSLEDQSRTFGTHRAAGSVLHFYLIFPVSGALASKSLPAS